MFAKIRWSAGLALSAFILLMGQGPARAADAPRLSQLTIRLWPEFDRPSVLVFLVGQTAQGTPLPATLTFHLPPGAQVNAVAYVDANNNLTDRVEHSVNGQTVSITTPTGSFHIEFYDALKIDGAGRDYRYTWQQAMTVDALSWDVEQPAAASGFQVEPGGTGGVDENGLPTTLVNGGALAANQPAVVHLSYTNPTNALSQAVLASTQPASQPGQPGEPDFSPVSLIIAIVILALAVAASAIMYFRATAGAPRAASAAEQPGGGRFCPQCGQAARPGDQFCRKCGTKLRG